MNSPGKRAAKADSDVGWLVDSVSVGGGVGAGGEAGGERIGHSLRRAGLKYEEQRFNVEAYPFHSFGSFRDMSPLPPPPSTPNLPTAVVVVNDDDHDGLGLN